MVKKSEKKKEQKDVMVKKIVTLALSVFIVVSLVALVVKSMNKPMAQTQDAVPTVIAKQEKAKVIAYYFHGTHRCWSCNTIEALSKEVIENDFKAEIDSGELEFVTINIDLPENRHFMQDFKTSSKMLVLTKYDNGTIVKFESMQDVWKLLRNKPAFFEYVKQGLKRYLSEV